MLLLLILLLLQQFSVSYHMLYAEQKILHVFVAFIEYFLYYSCVKLTLSYITVTMMPKKLILL